MSSASASPLDIVPVSQSSDSSLVVANLRMEFMELLFLVSQQEAVLTNILDEMFNADRKSKLIHIGIYTQYMDKLRLLLYRAQNYDAESSDLCSSSVDMCHVNCLPFTQLITNIKITIQEVNTRIGPLLFSASLNEYLNILPILCELEGLMKDVTLMGTIGLVLGRVFELMQYADCADCFNILEILRGREMKVCVTDATLTKYIQRCEERKAELTQSAEQTQSAKYAEPGDLWSNPNI